MSFSLKSLDTRINSESVAKKLVADLNLNELTNLFNEIFAKIYWAKRSPVSSAGSNAYLAKLNKLQRYIKKRLSNGCASPEKTQSGSIIERLIFPIGDTTDFFCRMLKSSSWNILFQESSYYAFWMNKDELTLCIFCEGDVVFIRSPDTWSFYSEYTKHCSWHGEHIATG